SLESRFEFSKLGTLLRLKAEYETAKMVIEEEQPTILFIDGRVSPLHSDLIDFSDQSELIRQAQDQLKSAYKDLIHTALNNQVLLCGVVKDSRSSETSSVLQNYIPQLIRGKRIDGAKIKGWRNILSGLLDEYFGEGILDVGHRTAWLRSYTPGWLNIGNKVEIWSCLARPILDDISMRLEVVYSTQLNEIDKLVDIALGAYNYLCNHGLPIAVPTIISDADSRARLSHFHLESVVDQIALTLGIPKDHLRKRRSFHMTLE
ncbi:MAG: DNA double-strand break repair nuclease NurA, partial [Candidatus Kariarchaeaceae archaeon]